MVKLAVAVGVEARHTGGGEGACGAATDNRDLAQGFAARLNHTRARSEAVGEIDAQKAVTASIIGQILRVRAQVHDRFQAH